MAHGCFLLLFTDFLSDYYGKHTVNIAEKITHLINSTYANGNLFTSCFTN